MCSYWGAGCIGVGLHMCESQVRGPECVLCGTQDTNMCRCVLGYIYKNYYVRLYMDPCVCMLICKRYACCSETVQIMVCRPVSILQAGCVPSGTQP